MTRRTFRVVNIVEILIHWKAGCKKDEVARSLAVDRGTVARYTAKVLGEGYVPGGDQLPAQEWGSTRRGLVSRTGRPPGVAASPMTRSRPAGHDREMLKTNTATTVHQRLRDEHGLSVGRDVPGGPSTRTS
jgi:hypothetical protein